MKSHRKFAVAVSVLFPLLLVCTILLANENTKEKPKRPIWGYAQNDGNTDVILHVKMKGGRYTDLILPVDGRMILPKGTIKVKVVPLNALRGTSRIKVDIRPSHYNPLKYWPRITKAGKSRTFSAPTDAIPLKDRSYLDADVIVPPGACEPEPEGTTPSDWELPESPPSKPAKVDRQSQLRELNDLYTKFSKRLTEVAPDSEEAKQIREALKKYSRDIDRYIAEEAAEHGPDWIETYRDKTGKLPGGLIEDAKSRLVKLREDMEKQKGKNAELEKEFERLKKKKSRNSEDNRRLGKLIKQLAEEKTKLKEMEEEIEQLEKEVSEEEEKKKQAKKISNLDGSWRGNDFEWSSVMINNGEGTASFGNFKVEKKKLVVYYDFNPFSWSIHKNNKRYHHEYEFSGTWQTSSGDWSGKIGLHLYNDRIIHVIYETYPGDNWTSDNFLREGSPPLEDDMPEED